MSKEQKGIAKLRAIAGKEIEEIQEQQTTEEQREQDVFVASPSLIKILRKEDLDKFIEDGTHGHYLGINVTLPSPMKIEGDSIHLLEDGLYLEAFVRTDLSGRFTGKKDMQFSVMCLNRYVYDNDNKNYKRQDEGLTFVDEKVVMDHNRVGGFNFEGLRFSVYRVEHTMQVTDDIIKQAAIKAGLGEQLEAGKVMPLALSEEMSIEEFNELREAIKANPEVVKIMDDNGNDITREFLQQPENFVKIKR